MPLRDGVPLTAPVVDARCEKRLATYTGFYPLRGRARQDASYSGDVFDDHWAARGLNPYVGAAISILLAARGPVAVFRAISEVVVAALYAQAGAIAGSHVGVEILKRLPSIANRDASAPITMESRKVRIAASTDHVLPNSVEGRVNSAVSGMDFLRSISRQAAATLAIATENGGCWNESLSTALAATKKDPWQRLSWIRLSKNGPAIECSADGGQSTIGSSHADLLYRSGWLEARVVYQHFARFAHSTLAYCQ